MDKNVLRTILVMLAVGAFVVICCCLAGKETDDEREKIWNDGYCTKCGAKLEFKNYSQGYTEKYAFQCTECKKIVVLEYNPYSE